MATKSELFKHQRRIEDYFQPLEKIRAELWYEAGIQTKHIDEQVAQKQLEEIQQQSTKLQQKTTTDAQEKKMKEEAVLNFLFKNDAEFERIKKEIEQPSQYQKQDKFTHKFALVFCNEKYSNTRLMSDLPAVKDDYKNMKLCVTMLNIPKENVFKFRDGNHKEIKEFHDNFKRKVLALTQDLKQNTGIGNKSLIKGLEWDRLKATAMNENQPND